LSKTRIVKGGTP